MGNRWTTGEPLTHFRPENSVRAAGFNDGFASNVAVSFRTLPLEQNSRSGEISIQKQHVTINGKDDHLVSIADACEGLLRRALQAEDRSRYAEGYPVEELCTELCETLMVRLPSDIQSRPETNAVVLDYGFRLGRELSHKVRRALASALEPEGYVVHSEVLQYPITREKRFIKDAILLGKGDIDLHEVISPLRRFLRRFGISS